MPTIVLPSTLKKTNQQIKALEEILSHDNKRDKQIHIRALNDLKQHREQLTNYKK